MCEYTDHRGLFVGVIICCCFQPKIFHIPDTTNGTGIFTAPLGWLGVNVGIYSIHGVSGYMVNRTYGRSCTPRAGMSRDEPPAARGRSKSLDRSGSDLGSVMIPPQWFPSPTTSRLDGRPGIPDSSIPTQQIHSKSYGQEAFRLLYRWWSSWWGGTGDSYLSKSSASAS